MLGTNSPKTTPMIIDPMMRSGRRRSSHDRPAHMSAGEREKRKGFIARREQGRPHRHRQLWSFFSPLIDTVGAAFSTEGATLVDSGWCSSLMELWSDRASFCCRIVASVMWVSMGKMAGNLFHSLAVVYIVSGILFCTTSSLEGRANLKKQKISSTWDPLLVEREFDRCALLSLPSKIACCMYVCTYVRWGKDFKFQIPCGSRPTRSLSIFLGSEFTTTTPRIRPGSQIAKSLPASPPSSRP
jgi:hypothetical protein